MEVVSWILLLDFWQFGDVAHDLRITKGASCVTDILVDAIYLPPGLLRDAQ